jgi:hypothetical protein
LAAKQTVTKKKTF